MLTRAQIRTRNHRLREVVQRIKRMPYRLNMSRWVDHNEACGTIACFAGHACWMRPTMKPVVKELEYLHRPGKYDIDRAVSLEEQIQRQARNWLKLTEAEGDKLFLVHEWPHTFRDAYVGALNHKAQAAILEQRVEHFIAVGE